MHFLGEGEWRVESQLDVVNVDVQIDGGLFPVLTHVCTVYAL